MKIGLLAGREVTASPEFEDCRRAAETHHVPVREVLAEAMTRHRDRETGSSIA